MKKFIPLFLIAFILSSTISLKATVIVITQQDLTFNPSSVTVSVGDTIRWLWTSGVHTTTSTSVPDGAQTWDSPLTSEVSQFEYVVTVAGNYSYVCTPHASLGMTGSFTASGTLGLVEKVISSNVRLYPNPAKEQTSLLISSVKSATAILSLYDLVGNRLISNEVLIKQGTNNLPVPIVEIQPGIYFVELKIENQPAIVRRFVKSR